MGVLFMAYCYCPAMDEAVKVFRGRGGHGRPGVLLVEVEVEEEDWGDTGDWGEG
jgi:hypothetical protein